MRRSSNSLHICYMSTGNTPGPRGRGHLAHARASNRTFDVLHTIEREERWDRGSHWVWRVPKATSSIGKCEGQILLGHIDCADVAKKPCSHLRILEDSTKGSLPLRPSSSSFRSCWCNALHPSLRFCSNFTKKHQGHFPRQKNFHNRSVVNFCLVHAFLLLHDCLWG